jgi:uncharacterized protein (TIGR03067 family)
MKLRSVVLVAVGLMLAADKPADEIKKELKKFEGTWKIVSVEAEGEKLPTDMFKDSKLVLKDDQFTFTEGKTVSKGTFKVDPSKKPKTIDIKFTEGPEKGQTLMGIYEIDGDTYKVCLDPTGKKRPTKFESKKGSGAVVEVLKREKK